MQLCATSPGISAQSVKWSAARTAGIARTRASSRFGTLRHARAGFTLAEVLAALVFMAIVIPVAVQGLRVANLAGQVGVRKAAAARVAERVLNEALVTGQWQQAVQSGTFAEGYQEYRWDLRVEPWTEGNLRLMTVQVMYPVQGQDYEVRLSTLLDTTQ